MIELVGPILAPPQEGWSLHQKVVAQFISVCSA